MTLALSVVPKIAAILPRLDSEHDGEVVATARAISRVLRAGGSDWHDFVAMFERGANAPAVKRQSKRGRSSSKASAPTWQAAQYWQQQALLDWLAAQSWLSPWEENFVASLAHQYPARPLSNKQIDVTERLLGRAFAERER